MECRRRRAGRQAVGRSLSDVASSSEMESFEQ